MIEVIPVQTLSVVVLSELHQVIVDHEPVTTNRHSGNSSQRFQLGAANFRIGRVISEQHVQPCNVKRTEAVNGDNVAHKLSLVHVERSRQRIHVNNGLGLGAHNQILVVVISVLEHTCGVVLGAGEHHHI